MCTEFTQHLFLDGRTSILVFIILLAHEMMNTKRLQQLHTVPILGSRSQLLV